jgi:hypothetical protein
MAMGFGRLDQCHLLLEWGAQPITARTEEIYSEHIAKHEQNPSAGVVQYKKDLPKALSPFIPVTTLANLVIEYVPNLEIQVMLNQARPPAADVH